MDRSSCVAKAACWGFGMLAWLAGCSADTPMTTRGSGPVQLTAAGSSSLPLPGSTGAQAAAGSGAARPAAVGGTVAGNTALPAPAAGDGCAASSSLKKEGCPCRSGETAACWTGAPRDRNLGACHDGVQTCRGDASSEFSSWGPCVGEQQICGSDAGIPEQKEECGCIPGAVIQCSEDCTVGIFCSFSSTKTCLPDGTWSVCRESPEIPVDLPGVQCRNMLHGCAGILLPDMTQPSAGELFVGDCSKQFKCGHAPDPVVPQ